MLYIPKLHMYNLSRKKEYIDAFATVSFKIEQFFKILKIFDQLLNFAYSIHFLTWSYY